MAVTSYTTLKAEISNHVDESYDSADADTFIDLAEARINRELRVVGMETALSVVLSSGQATIPAGFRELRYAAIDGSPVQPLEVMSLSHLIERYPTRTTQGKPCFIAVDGASFSFGPFPDSDYTLIGSYYKAFDPLSGANETNWLTTNAPDLLLFACLHSACRFLRDDAGAERWSMFYHEAKQEVESEQRGYIFSRDVPLAGRVAY